MVPKPAVAAVLEDDTSWLDAFHAGDPDVLETCYRKHFRDVDLAVGRVLQQGADRETVVQEVFLQLLSNSDLRRGFAGGTFGAWIATLARNRAIDFWRRYQRERALEEAPPEAAGGQNAVNQMEAQLLIEQFIREVLPKKWLEVFKLRFLAELDQRTAAERLGIRRTTLAYQEVQVRRLLRRFLLRRGEE